MKTASDRIKEQRNQARAERERKKRAKAPVVVEVMIGNVLVNVPLAEVYAPLIKQANDPKLLEFAKKNKIALTQEQAFLVQEGDTFLPQFEKIQLNDEEEFELIEQGWNPLRSSNIQAVRMDGDDLLIRFHSGADYRYAGRAELFYPFNEALSPGRLLWRTIRPEGVEI
jgi:hypothetical protein